jgi:hypothetical protein
MSYTPTLAEKPTTLDAYLAQQQGINEAAQNKAKSTLHLLHNIATSNGKFGAVAGEAITTKNEAATAQQEWDRIRNQAEADPWGFYRKGFADILAQNQGVDPSNIYRDKLAAMSGGNFDIDDPSYKWRFEQGQQALERSQAARGLLGSGNAAIELQEYGQGAASQEYSAQFSRLLQGMVGVQQQYTSQQARLMQLAGVGLDPLGSRKVGVGEVGNAVAAQGNQLQAQSQANRLGFEQTQWQDQLNMNAEYQQGLRQGMSPPSPSFNGYSAY